MTGNTRLASFSYPFWFDCGFYCHGFKISDCGFPISCNYFYKCLIKGMQEFFFTSLHLATGNCSLLCKDYICCSTVADYWYIVAS